jgi:hypothetical protein
LIAEIQLEVRNKFTTEIIRIEALVSKVFIEDGGIFILVENFFDNWRRCY